MSMFMSVGTPYCCGVLEIFPRGEFTPARGHGYVCVYVYGSIPRALRLY